MQKRRLTMFQKILIAGAFVLAFSFVLFGCARPQPMGEDLWIGLRHIENQR